MELSLREKAVILALRDGPKGVNELFRILKKEGLASDKRQVTKSISKLEELGLVERRGEGKGQRVEVRLTQAGELAAELEEAKHSMEALRRRVYVLGEIDAETLGGILKATMGIELKKEELERLAAAIRNSVKKGLHCEGVADAFLAGLAISGFLYGYLERQGSPLAEWVADHMKEIVAVIEDSGCMEHVQKRINELVAQFKESMIKTILSIMNNLTESALAQKADVDGE